MTPADHANTIRDALIEWGTHLNKYRQREDALAALDALQAQAEEQSEIEAQYRLASEQWRKRAETAEAERDKYKAIAEKKYGFLAKRVIDAEADRDEIRNVNRELVAQTEQRIEAAEAERDRAIEASNRQYVEMQTLKAERDRLRDALALAKANWRDAADQAETLEAARDRLADALQHIADATWTATTGDSISPREYARDALDWTEQP